MDRKLSFLGWVSWWLLLFSTISHAQEIPQLSLYIPLPYQSDWLNEVIYSFEAVHPEVNITVVSNTPFGQSTFRPASNSVDNHLEDARLFVSGADVLFVETNNSISIPATLANLFLNLQPLAATDSQLNTDQFRATAWQSFVWNGGLWALPATVDLPFLLYKADRFDQANLAYPNENWTLTDLANSLEILQTGNSEAVLHTTGQTMSFMRSWLVTSPYNHISVQPQPDFNNSDYELFVQQWNHLVEQKKIEFAVERMNDADLVLRVGLARDLPLLEAGDFQLAPLPGYRSPLKVGGFAVSSGTQQPELAYQLARYLAENMTQPQTFAGLASALNQDIRTELSTKLPTQDLQLLQKLLENALPATELAYFDYILQAANTALDTGTAVSATLAEAQYQANDMLQTLTTATDVPTIIVNTPIPSSVGSNLRLTFLSPLSPLPNQNEWDTTLAEFAQTNLQIDQVELVTNISGSIFDVIPQTDCLILPFVPDFNLSARLLPLDPLLATDPNFQAQDFIGDVLQQVQINNQTYSYPLSIQPQAMWYQTDVFKANGIPFPEETWSTADFASALTALQSAGIQPAWSALSTNRVSLLMLIAAYGGLPVDYRTSPITFDLTSSANQDAIANVLDLARQGSLAYTSLLNPPQSNTIRHGTTPLYSENLTYLSAQSFSSKDVGGYRLIDFPIGSLYHPVSYGLLTAAISASTAHPESCYQLFQTLSSKPMLFPGLPPRYSQLQSPTLVAAKGSDTMSYYLTFADALHESALVTFPESGQVDIDSVFTLRWLDRVFDRYVFADADLSSELAAAAQWITDFRGCTHGIPSLPSGIPTPEELNKFFQEHQSCALSVDPTFGTP